MEFGEEVTCLESPDDCYLALAALETSKNPQYDEFNISQTPDSASRIQLLTDVLAVCMRNLEQLSLQQMEYTSNQTQSMGSLLHPSEASVSGTSCVLDSSDITDQQAAIAELQQQWAYVLRFTLSSCADATADLQVSH